MCHVRVPYRIILASVTANKDIYLTQLWVLSQSKWVSSVRLCVYVYVYFVDEIVWKDKCVAIYLFHTTESTKKID